MEDNNKPEQEIIPPGQPLPGHNRMYDARSYAFRFYSTGRGGASSPLLDKFLLSLGALSGAAVIAFIVYTIAHFYAGFLGLQYHLGTFWALLFVVVCLWGRMTLPITIGAFFGALQVWHWHWFFALLFAAPALVVFIALTIPLLVGSRRP